MNTTKILEALIVISLAGDVVAGLSGLGAKFSLAVTQGSLGAALLMAIYKEWRKRR